MSRTNVDIDDEACAAIMRRYRLASKREAVNLAPRTLAAGQMSLAAARRLRGSGWEGDLDEMRGPPRNVILIDTSGMGGVSARHRVGRQ